MTNDLEGIDENTASPSVRISCTKWIRPDSSIIDPRGLNKLNLLLKILICLSESFFKLENPDLNFYFTQY